MLTHYIFVRRDLTVGKMAAMVTHAAGESGGLFGEFPYDSCRAVVLEARGEKALTKVLNFLKVEDIPHVPIYEANPPYKGQLMSIGLIPVGQEVVEERLKKYQILTTLDEPVVDNDLWGV